MQQCDLRQTAARLIQIRSEILESHPFFGRLLMRIPFGFADCKTAYTDMHRIVFDPSFAARLSDKELCFVLMHELMHCVLKHCVRAKNKLQSIYNIACDTVVNSIILEAMGLNSIEIDGSEAMHLSPDGNEGRNYSAEEIYEMLINNVNESLMKDYETSIFDNHEIWEEVAADNLIEKIWDSYIRKSAREAGRGSGIPNSIERYISKIYHTSKISWKQVLHDYIQNDQCDYVFSRPDKRYSGKYIMPSFQENVDGSRLDKVFFFIDTSGSVTSKTIAEAFEEIKDAIYQIGNISGTILFFDTEVSEPMSFDSVDDIEKMKPIGGGGTSFKKIFEYVKKCDTDEYPLVIIIITDGYAEFPDESESLDIPVVWLIVNSDVEAPWGECLHVFTDEQ